MLWRAVGEPTSDAVLSFADNASIDKNYIDAVKWGVENGIINGYNDGNFRPNKVISRAEMATFMYRYLKNVANYDFGEVTPVKFADASSIAAPYVEAVNAIVSAGIMNGTTATTFEPNTTANRGMVATVILRLHNLLAD